MSGATIVVRSKAATKPMQFIDLQPQRKKMGSRLDDAITSVLEHGQFVMGPEVAKLEEKLADFTDVAHAVSCANGTDALKIPLLAWDIGPGDAVFCPSFTFAATAEVIALVGAEPVMIDILPDTFNLDPDDLERAINQTNAEGRLKPRAIIAVDLFGLPADYPRIQAIAGANDLKVIADSAQGFGCLLEGRHPISWADVATTSFFPAKPLGCYGDGGAIFTNDQALADEIYSVREHGKGTDKYAYRRIGLNSRLDTLQAAILLEKLALFPEEIEMRNVVANRYSQHIHNIVETPHIPPKAQSVWAQYTIKTNRRDALATALKKNNIPTAIYYPKPLHKQDAYKQYPQSPSGLPICNHLSQEVISLPMHPYLSKDDQDRVIGAIHDFFSS